MAKYDNPKLKALGYFPVGRVAGVVGKHRTTLLRLLHADKIAGQKDGEGWYVFVPSLIEHLEAQNAAMTQPKGRKLAVPFVDELRKLVDDGKAEGKKGARACT